MKRVLTALTVVLCAGAVAAPAQAAFPGANGKIAFVINREESSYESGNRLAVVHPDGTGFAFVTRGRNSPMGAIWSPDGERFLSWSPEFGGVYVYAADGTLVSEVGNHDYFYRFPTSWFPDGRVLIFTYPGQPDDIDPPAGPAIGPAAGPFSPWQGAPVTDVPVDVSPDGTRLAYLRDKVLRVVGIDGSNDRALATGVDAFDWAPDGGSLVYAARSAPGSLVQLSVIGLSPGSSARRLTTDGQNTRPAWSPDGEQVAFLSDRSGDFQLWRMPVAGGAATKLTELPVSNNGWEYRMASLVDVDWQPLPGTQPPRVNRPPTCGGVRVSPSTLTHRAGRLGQVTIGGAVDPEGSGLSWKITGVTQDEAVGWSRASAVRTQWSRTVALRRDRLPWSDGRVYAISFRVSDWQGAACTGTVKVGVPNGDRPARDSGQRFDSFTGAPLPRR